MGCCGGGCGEVYRNEILEMLETLKLVEASNILTKNELNQLFRAVVTYNEDSYEKVK